MFSTLRTRFGIPGVISVMALVFAMLGGAYAASNSSGGGKATASAKGKKGPRGPKGPKGDTGPAGPAGPAGSAGTKGDAGANGKDGTNGTPGAPGVSVTTKSFNTSEEGNCTVGGTKFTSVSGSTYACNGEDGDPWTVGGVLPPGETETGTWVWGPIPKEVDGESLVTEAKLALSLPIPLADGTELEFNYVTKADAENHTIAACPGSAAEPTAAPGNLCMYEAFLFGGGTFSSVASFNPSTGEGASVGPTGAIVTFFEVEEGGQRRGNWAATAPLAG